MPRCTECSIPHLFSTVSALQQHLTLCHNLQSLKIFRCKEDDCSRDFSMWRSFGNHLVEKHNCVMYATPDTCGVVKSVDENCETICPHNLSTDVDMTEDFLYNLSSISDNDPHVENTHRVQPVLNDTVPQVSENDLYVLYRSLCAKLYATPDLPRSYVQDTYDTTKNFVEELISLVKPTLYQALQLTEDQIVNANRIFESITSPFQSMSTEYRRLRMLNDVGFITPKSYIVGTSIDNKLVDGRIKKQTTPLYAQCIPLRETLHGFFSLPGVLDTVVDYMGHLMDETEILSNFVQGKLWREKVGRHFSGKTVIPLFIYFDDFEINNPLGSHKGIQKLGGAYCSIPCLPPEFCSSIENIFMVLLFHASDRKSFGNESIFKILIDELNDLQENGIVFEQESAVKTIYFSLGLITGDNLGLNSMFDFVESFRGSHFCRICNISGREANVDCFEKVDRLRRPIEYENDLQIGGSNSGVKKRSIWNDVKYFHIYENYYMDPLHDLSEGALKYGMAHMLHYYVFDAKNKIDLELINARMRTFNYTASNITNRPPPIRWNDVKDRKLSMSGSEMINFVYIFPLLVGDHIVLDRVWDYFIVLRNILFIVAARNIQVECAVLLNSYVREHHTLYKELFNDELKAKHHNMVHYARVMVMSGPVGPLSTIRNESKNRQFKLSANATYSRRNITFSLAMKEAFRLCHRKLCQRGLVSKFDVGPGKIIESPSELHYYRHVVNLDFQRNVLQVPWVNLKGIIYRIGTCLVLELDSNDIPEFGQIKTILSDDTNRVIFRCTVFSNIQFHERFDAWEVVATEKIEFREPVSLFTPFVCINHRIGSGQQFVTAKHVL